MYVTMNRVKTSDESPGDAGIVGEGLEDWLREVEGFEGMIMLSRPGTSVGLTFWESREVAERHQVARREFRDSVTAAVNVQVEETIGYELTFAHLGPRLVELRR